MAAGNAPIAWIDVETTGIGAVDNDLLEIAAVITRGNQYEPVDEGVSVTIHPDRFIGMDPGFAAQAITLAMPDVVTQMHTDSGLLADIAEGRTVPLAEADATIQDYLARHTVAGEPIMGGNSITLDREFLAMYAPRTFEHLNYQSLDCTSVCHFVRRLPWIDSDVELSAPAPGAPHRALADVHSSIRQARLLSSLVGPVVPEDLVQDAA